LLYYEYIVHSFIVTNNRHNIIKTLQIYKHMMRKDGGKQLDGIKALKKLSLY